MLVSVGLGGLLGSQRGSPSPNNAHKKRLAFVAPAGGRMINANLVAAAFRPLRGCFQSGSAQTGLTFDLSSARGEAPSPPLVVLGSPFLPRQRDGQRIERSVSASHPTSPRKRAAGLSGNVPPGVSGMRGEADQRPPAFLRTANGASITLIRSSDAPAESGGWRCF